MCKRHNAHNKQDDYRSGVIVATIANMFKGEKDTLATPATFFPSLADEEKRARKQGAMTPEQIKAILQTYYPPENMRQ